MANQTPQKTNKHWALSFEQKMEEHYSKNSMINYRVDIWHFIDYLGETHQLLDTTTEFLDAYLIHLSQLVNEEGVALYKQATINRNRASLVAFFNFLKEEGVMESNPATNLKTITIYRRGEENLLEHLTQEESKALLTHIRTCKGNSFKKARDLVLYHLMLSTGICMNEIATLTYDQFDFNTQLLTIVDKDGGSRQVPFPSTLKPEIEAYLIEREKAGITSDLFLVSNRGTTISIQNSNQALQKYGNRLGFGRKVSNIALRHTYAINLLKLGVSVEEVTRLLGNKTTQYTSILYQSYINSNQLNYADQLELGL